MQGSWWVTGKQSRGWVFVPRLVQGQTHTHTRAHTHTGTHNKSQTYPYTDTHRHMQIHSDTKTRPRIYTGTYRQDTQIHMIITYVHTHSRTHLPCSL